jgi:gliding motility-associated-like protein
MQRLLICSLFFFSGHLSAQQFVNPDLEGTVTFQVPGDLPSAWSNVPTTFWGNEAAVPNVTNTADLTNIDGPFPEYGIFGIPHSGNSFVSGNYSLSYTHLEYYHEGINQTAFGFEVDSLYYISFFQSVVRQVNLRDSSGSWSVYRNEDLISVSRPSHSEIEPEDPNLDWERRVALVQATDNVQIIRFLPTDDDEEIGEGGEDMLTDGIRMGIDSLSIHPKCHFDFQIGDADTMVICQDETLILRPNRDDLVLSWEDNSSADSLLVTRPGYYAAVAYKGECMVFDEVIVVSDAENAFDLAEQHTGLCPSDTIVLQAPSYGLPTWSDGSHGTTLSITEAGIYSLEVQSGNCLQRDTVTILDPPFVGFYLGADTTLCQGDSLVIQLDDYEETTYLWSDQSNQPSLTILEPGIYTCSLTWEQCSLTDTIQVDYLEPEMASLGPDQVLCNGDEILLTIDQPVDQYLWQDGTSTASYLVDSPGTYAVTVTINECSVTDTVQITPSALQPFSLGADTTLCVGETLPLTGPGIAESYLWSNEMTTADITVNTAGTYSLVTTLGACTESDEIEISYHPLQPFSIGNDTTLCPGDSLVLTVDNPSAAILWSDGTTANTLLVTSPGLYGLTLSLAECEQVSDVWVDYFAPTTVSIGKDTTICQGSALVLTPSFTGPPPTYRWQDGSEQSTFVLEEAGTYQVDIENECTMATAIVDVTIEECTCEVYLPNAFSPNGDGTNDTFRSYTTCPITDYDLQIFDRWGGLRFTSNNMEEEWQGLEVNSGVYLYTLRYRDRDGQWQQRVGEVHLLR